MTKRTSEKDILHINPSKSVPNKEEIILKGVRTHNIKNIDVTIPRNQMVVITGLSGSGKSSLAFDTIYAEGQRRYVESLSTYARQFLNLMDKPDVDSIEGLSPAIAIEQKSTSHNPRSTVGTITEIYDYLRLLFARIGVPKCPEHGLSLKAQSQAEILDAIMKLPENGKFMLLSPIIQSRKGEYQKLFADLQRQGFLRSRVDGEIILINDKISLNKNKKHSIDVVVDRFVVEEKNRLRISESINSALKLSDGLVIVIPMGEEKISDTANKEMLFSNRFACPICNYSVPLLEPKMFSFNNPAGSCSRCDGLGFEQTFNESLIVPNINLSINEGAISYFSPQQQIYFQQLKAVCKHHDIDMDSPYDELPDEQIKIIMHGSKDKINMSFALGDGEYKKKKSFEGVVGNFGRRYKETDSENIREMLRKLMSIQECATCGGSRLNTTARNVFIEDENLPSLNRKNIETLLNYFKNLNISDSRGNIAKPILREITERLIFLNDVGLSYLSLGRTAGTLSGGESQRIRLASQIGSGLVGVMYVLDEPSIGLHQRDNDKLLSSLKRLRDLGNTLIVIEHDEDTMREADHIIDIGPGAGLHGGKIVSTGSFDEIVKENNPDSYTSQFLSGRRKIAVPKNRLPGNGQYLKLTGASGNNLQDVNVEIKLGTMTCITGVSGSGKSTLINHTLYPALANKINRDSDNIQSSSFSAIEGYKNIDKVVDIDQSPIGRTPRSNPATYTGVFTLIRDLFTALPESKARGYSAGRFSFNVKGGRCEECEGDGIIKVEMHFMSDVYITCERCKGKRYNEETLQILYKGKSIHDVLSMSIEEACTFFENVASIKNKLQTLFDVGLGYITLGHSATHLSGGEAQRVKLSKELSKRSTGKTFYILDEPTTGLHFHDIDQLLHILARLRNNGNTVVVIEHNLDVIKCADWIIDMGPEGGDGGGKIIATGTPENIVKNKQSHTGQYLNPYLK